ncbi:MAG: hypothetical protein M1818_001792 [Claussenomyces sp. TS43310]|nr:MAG: hypothetical protein M1818_001792 [Claussenomyces sp. TS43310]
MEPGNKVKQSKPRRYLVSELFNIRKTLGSLAIDMKSLTPEGASSGIVNIPLGTHTNALHFVPATRNLTDDADLPYSGILRHMDDSEEEVLYKPRSNQCGDWGFARVEDPDRVNEPHSAPSGEHAQKAENFRRFFQAVVSPTHVRVTAGGRIVPNTRPPKQPQFTWNYDKHYFEQMADQINSNNSGLGATDQFSPQTHLSAAPCDFGPPLNQAVAGSGDYTTISEHTAQPTERESPIAMKGNSNGRDTSSLGQQEIVISPPGQFDVSKPFIYNGQLVYPMPPGFVPPMNLSTVPFGILGNPNALQHPYGTQLGTFFPTPVSVPGQTVTHPSMNTSAGQSIALGATPGFQSMFGTSDPRWFGQPGPAMSMLQPLPTSQAAALPMTVVAKQKIEELEQQIKWVENQLENNKHQVDEVAMSQQRNTLQTQSQALQSALADHLAHQSVQHKNFTALQPNQAYAGANPGDVAFALEDSTNNARLHTSHGQGTSTKTDTADDKTTHGNTTLASERSGDIAQVTSASGTAGNSKLTSRSRLSAAAAMAPPFQPRSQCLISAQLGNGKETNNSGENEAPNSNHPEKIAFKSPKDSFATNVPYWEQLPSATSMYGYFPAQPPLIPRAHTMHGQETSNPFGGFAIPSISSSFGATTNDDVGPYLMGFPPPGMTFAKAQSTDLVYSRPLTEEEIRARHLYWGKAPHEVSKGLPKFDGRDFYPPSPIKKHAVAAPTIWDRPSFGDHGARYSLFSENSQGSRSSHRGHFTNRPHHIPEQVSATQPAKTSPLKVSKTAEQANTSNGRNSGASIDSWSQPKLKSNDQGSLEHESAMTRSLPPSIKPIHLTSDSSSASCSRTHKSQPQFGSSTTVHRQPTFLQGILKNTPRQSMAAPVTGTLSSTTAHGYLPLYTGQAAAALAPSRATGSPASPALHRRDIDDHDNKGSRPQSMQSRRSENFPPAPSSAQKRGFPNATDLLRRLSRVQRDHQEVAKEPWNTLTTGIGPVAPGAEW